MIKKLKLFYLAAFLLLSVSASSVSAQTNTFTYQGRFTDTTIAQQPTNGTYSMTFRLYDAASGGSQVGSPIVSSVTVVNGVFTAQLDFGATAFNTTGARFLEVQVGATILTPRQSVTSAPFAQRTLNSGAADALSVNCVLCIQNGQLAANSITTSKVANGTITESKIFDDQVTSIKIANNTIVNADVSPTAAIDGTKVVGSTITGLNAANLASGTVPVARLGTNAPSATTYLRGDNTWQPVSSGTTTLPFAARSTSLVLTSGTYIDVISINLEAGKTYIIDSSILGQRVGGTSGGGTFQVVYSGTATTEYGMVSNGLIADTIIDSTPSYDTEAAGFTTTYTGLPAIKYSLSGYLRTTTAGTLTIRAARASSNTTIDLNIREGSYLTARPIN